MNNVKGLIDGIYPKDENLRILIGRWQRGILGVKDLNNRIDEETEEFLKFRGENILSSDPLYNWFDIFRPLLGSLSGFEVGPLRRLEYTNTFYREPKIVGKPKFRDSEASGKDNIPGPVYRSKGGYGFLPGPETFFSYSYNDAKLKKEDFIVSILEAYGDLLRNFSKEGVIIMERVPVHYDTLISIKEVLGNKKIVLDAIAGFSERKNENPNESEIQIMRIFEAKTTTIESKEKIIKQLEKVNSGNVLIGFNDYPDFLPRVIADKKVKVMKEVVENE
ncbi:hypothetical protein [Caldiplasma sukawensis]